jgi:nitroreductase
MEFQQVVERRRMVRNYDPDRPVPPEVVDRLMTNALHAPSAGFSQGWGFLVLTESADRDLFWTATRDDGPPDPWLQGMRRAPVVIVCFSHKDAYLDRYAEPDKGFTDRDDSWWTAPYWDIDTGMAALLVLLTAVDGGLGGCFFGVPLGSVDALRAAFGVPDGFHPVGVVTVGYRMQDRKSPSLKRGRRGADQVVHRGRWGVTPEVSPVGGMLAGPG